MISYLINAMIDGINPQEQQVEEKTRKTQKKEDLVDRRTLNKIKSETLNSPEPVYPRASQNLLADIMGPYRPSYYERNAPFLTSTEKSLVGWVCYNDDRLRPLIESFPELNIMPKGDVRFWINANWRNVDRVVLVYIYIEDEDEKLNGLLAELKSSTNGNVYLICLTEGSSGPVSLNTFIPRSYITLRTKRVSNGISEVFALDEDGRGRVSEFIRVDLSKTSYLPVEVVEKKKDWETKEIIVNAPKPEPVLKEKEKPNSNLVVIRSSYAHPENNLITSTTPARKTESYAYSTPIENYSNPYYPNYNNSDLGVGDVILSNRAYKIDLQQPQQVPVQRVERVEETIFGAPKIEYSAGGSENVIFDASEKIILGPKGEKTKVIAPNDVEIQHESTQQPKYSSQYPQYQQYQQYESRF